MSTIKPITNILVGWSCSTFLTILFCGLYNTMLMCKFQDNMLTCSFHNTKLKCSAFRTLWRWEITSAAAAHMAEVVSPASVGTYIFSLPVFLRIWLEIMTDLRKDRDDTWCLKRGTYSSFPVGHHFLRQTQVLSFTCISHCCSPANQ